jgi:hypothetical protein
MRDRTVATSSRVITGDGEIVDNTCKANIPKAPAITNDIKAKMPVRVEGANMPENPYVTGLSGQDDVLINGWASMERRSA